MKARYRYRMYPNAEQREMLSRTFGCARVVFNDAIRCRDDAYKAGEKLSDTEVQRRVITLAKQAPGRVYLAKIGDVKVEWSRGLPSEPSSVTVIMEPDGRYYLSFCVERAAEPQPEITSEAGIDMGLASLLVTSDGEVIENPRFYRARERKLKRLQREASRKVKGSANHRKANKRVAAQHRKVRDARLDHAHKTALRLVRDNQAVYAEDLAVSGLARTRLAKSVHDAGWSQILRLVEEKAEYYGRTFRKIGRFVPSSQMCSACGRVDGKKPLDVRAWECTCGAVHDRDVNAARNILAAGQADRLNASGARVRPAVQAAA